MAKSGKNINKEQRHPNRQSKRDSKQAQGNQELADESKFNSEEYKLNWFKPTDTQKDIILSMCQNDLTAIQGSSGTGKSTTVIYQALQDLKRGLYKQMVFIKTPVECGSDQIGFLSGDKNEKLSVHLEAMRSIFHTFMSKGKLTMEEKREHIVFTIPNFIQGKTFDNALVILDEAQSINDETTKLILERIGEGSRMVIMGDKKQRYAAKKRSDGFTNFVDMITNIDEDGVRVSKEPTMGYIEMTAKDNMRSDLSRRIVELYEQE